ncbi:MAG: NAD(P)-dependent alcohol dehydrogenase [Myxococcota bacterium]
MRRWEITEFGSDLRLVTDEGAAEASLLPHQVRVRLTAWSLNYRDLLVSRGQYNPRQKLPLVPVSDGYGEITEVGAEVQQWKVGDRVCPLFAPRWQAGSPTREAARSLLGSPLDGCLREEMILEESAVVRPPSHLSPTEAATLPCAALTAWSALAVESRTLAGDTVLTQGTGGVSIFAVQIAKILGARVIATSSSDEKLARLKELGADEAINYRSDPDWGKTARGFTGGRGVDHVIDVGGASTLPQSLRAVTIGGTISLIGILGGRKEPFDVIPVMMNQIRLQGILVGHRAGFESMGRAMEAHQLRPLVDRTFRFEEAPEAFSYLASGAHFGKVCLAP